MTTLKINEAFTVQFPMVKHAVEIGWTPLTQAEAEAKRHGRANMLFRDDLEAKLLEFNHWLSLDPPMGQAGCELIVPVGVRLPGREDPPDLSASGCST